MKLSVIRNIMSLVLAITMLILPNASYAATQIEEVGVNTSNNSRALQWSYLYECEHVFEKTEGESRKLTLYASTEVDEGRAGVYAQLQKRSSNGTSWDDVDGKEWERYSATDYVSMEYLNISVGAGTYRFLLIHMALDENGDILESFSAYTSEVTIY